MPASVNGLPVGPIDARAGLQAARGQRDVGGDDDVALAGTLGDPVVGGVRAVGDDHALDQRPLGQAHQAVRHEVDDEPVPLGHAHGLVLHGAGVGVDVEGGGQSGASASTKIERAEGDSEARRSDRLDPLVRLLVLDVGIAGRTAAGDGWS